MHVYSQHFVPHLKLRERVTSQRTFACFWVVPCVGPRENLYLEHVGEENLYVVVRKLQKIQ